VQVTIPLAPPLMMTTAHISDGRMGLNVANVRLHPTADPMTIQAGPIVMCYDLPHVL